MAVLATQAACASAPAPERDYRTERLSRSLQDRATDIAPSLDLSDMGVDCFDLTQGIFPEARLSTCRVWLDGGDKLTVVFGERKDGRAHARPTRRPITQFMRKVEKVEYRRADTVGTDESEVVFHISPRALSGGAPEKGGVVLFDVSPHSPGYGPGRATYIWRFDRAPQLQPIAPVAADVAATVGEDGVKRDE